VCGIFKHTFVANLLLSPSVKKFENRLIFGEVMGKSLVFVFDSQCSLPFVAELRIEFKKHRR